MKLNNNDDSHNSGLNLLIYNMLLDIESHPAWVCGLKLDTTTISVYIRCHTLRGCVDWNTRTVPVNTAAYSHTLRGCVDWNFQDGRVATVPSVTPCVGVWIETENYSFGRRGAVVTPCVGVWIET